MVGDRASKGSISDEEKAQIEALKYASKAFHEHVFRCNRCHGGVRRYCNEGLDLKHNHQQALDKVLRAAPDDWYCKMNRLAMPECPPEQASTVRPLVNTSDRWID